MCKDLGLTYPEVLKLRRPFLDWHFLNAMERRKKEFEEKEEERNFWIALMQPETYKEMERKKNAPQTEAETYEDIEYGDLKQIGQLARKRMQQSVRVEETPPPAEEPDTSAYINPVSWE